MIFEFPSFGHAGDGNLHIYICRDKLDEQVWKEKLEKVFEEMYEKAAEVGGAVQVNMELDLQKKNI